MSVFSVDEEEAQERAEMYKAAVGSKLSETALAASSFGRPGGIAASAIALTGGLPEVVLGLVRKKKAGGLPANFLLAVTPTKVHAYKYKIKGKNVKPKHVKEEVAVWDRTAIRVTSEPKSVGTRVTIESPGEGEKVVCDGVRGFLTDNVVKYLKDPSLTS